MVGLGCERWYDALRIGVIGCMACLQPCSSQATFFRLLADENVVDRQGRLYRKLDFCILLTAVAAG